MHNRLKEIRKVMNLKQNEFAEKLGITQASLSNLEHGKAKLTDHHIKIICLSFGVSETWLKIGIGTMRPEKTQDDELFFSEYLTLFPESKDFLRNILKNLTETQTRLVSFQSTHSQGV
jgi:transcriptional regulator with XRE-family HTH domain